MKVIDILNKIANGEEVPKYIKVYNETYEYDSFSKLYWNSNNKQLLDVYNGRILNYEVEIIEEDKPKTLNDIRESYGLPRIEDKKIEKLEIETQNKETGNCYITNEYGTKCYLTKHSRIIANKVNEIIDYLNKENK